MFMFKQGPDFYFEISEVEITRVDCSSTTAGLIGSAEKTFTCSGGKTKRSTDRISNDVSIGERWIVICVRVTDSKYHVIRFHGLCTY